MGFHATQYIAKHLSGYSQLFYIAARMHRTENTHDEQRATAHPPWVQNRGRASAHRRFCIQSCVCRCNLRHRAASHRSACPRPNAPNTSRMAGRLEPDVRRRVNAVAGPGRSHTHDSGCARSSEIYRVLRRNARQWRCVSPCVSRSVDGRQNQPTRTASCSVAAAGLSSISATGS